MSKLNELIAEKVMGWHLNPHYGDKQHYPYQMYERPNMDAIPTHEFQPATHLDDALLCLERAANGNAWNLNRAANGYDKQRYMVITNKAPYKIACGEGETAALAMCLCALRSVGVPESLITQAIGSD